MSGCEAGILVVGYVVLAFGIIEWVDFRRIRKRLDEIEKLLVSATEKHLDNNDNVHGSEEKKEHTFKQSV